MPVHRTYQPSDIEKRLKLLTQQLYGKQKEVAGRKYYVAREETEKDVPHTTSYELSTSDVAFLKKDLTKIAILASLAIGAQFILYFSQIPNKIKLF